MSAREHQISARELERRAGEAEGRAERMARRVLEGEMMLPLGSPKDSPAGDVNGKIAERGGEGDESGIRGVLGNEDREKEVWRLLENAREDVDDEHGRSGKVDGAEIGGGVVEIQKNR